MWRGAWGGGVQSRTSTAVLCCAVCCAACCAVLCCGTSLPAPAIPVKNLARMIARGARRRVRPMPPSQTVAGRCCYSAARPTVAVGISGGVDSAVAAHILNQQGHHVVGLHVRSWDEVSRGHWCHWRAASALYNMPMLAQRDETGECSGEADRRDAQDVCKQLGIHLHEVHATVLPLRAMCMWQHSCAASICLEARRWSSDRSCSRVLAGCLRAVPRTATSGIHAESRFAMQCSCEIWPDVGLCYGAYGC
jgi:hypothetical protein